MFVRRLTRDDAAAYRYIRLEALRLHPNAYGSTYEGTKDRPLDHYARMAETRMIFGLFDDANLVGLIAYDPDDARQGIVTAVYLRASLRGNGHALRLLDAVEAQARSDRMLALSLMVATDNHAARRTYERAGFHPTDDPAEPLGQGNQTRQQIKMVKRFDRTG